MGREFLLEFVDSSKNDIVVWSFNSSDSIRFILFRFIDIGFNCYDSTILKQLGSIPFYDVVRISSLDLKGNPFRTLYFSKDNFDFFVSIVTLLFIIFGY